MATQITVPIGERTKSVKFGAAYSPSQTFNPDKDLFFQGSMVLEGMTVTVNEVPDPDVATVQPGTFIQNGIIVDITASQDVDVPSSPTWPLYLVAENSDEVFNSPVDIQFTTTPAAGSVIIAEWPTGPISDFDMPLRASISNLRDVLKDLDRLRPIPSTVLDDKIKILSGRYTKSDGVEFVDIPTPLDSPALPVVTTGNARYDVISIDDTGTIIRTPGPVVTAPGDPFTDAPLPPIDELALAIVKVDEDTTVVIDESDITDVREFLRRPKLDKEFNPSSISASQEDDYDVTGGGTLLAFNEVQLTSSVDTSITGLANGFSAAKVTLVNAGSNSITLTHEDTDSDAANRMILLRGTNLTLEPGDSVELTYFGVGARWRQISIAVPGEFSPDPIAIDQDDYDVTGGKGLRVLNSARLTSSAVVNITGLSNGFLGATITLINIGSNNITLTHEDTDSDAANRMILLGGANLTLEAGDTVELTYLSADARWKQTS